MIECTADGDGCCGCGKCCNEYRLEMPYDPEMARFYTYHGGRIIPAGKGKMWVDFQDRCVNYLGPTKGCRIYEQRPKICRDYLCDRARYGKLNFIERKEPK